VSTCSALPGLRHPERSHGGYPRSAEGSYTWPGGVSRSFPRKKENGRSGKGQIGSSTFGRLIIGQGRPALRVGGRSCMCSRVFLSHRVDSYSARRTSVSPEAQTMSFECPAVRRSCPEMSRQWHQKTVASCRLQVASYMLQVACYRLKFTGRRRGCRAAVGPPILRSSVASRRFVLSSAHAHFA